MPIQRENRDRYPPEWPLISLWVRVCAGWRCAWCDAVQGEPHPVTGSLVVLTVAHTDNPAPEDVRPGNLAALCQRCHLNHDRRHHLQVQTANRRAAMRTLELPLDCDAPPAGAGGVSIMPHAVLAALPALRVTPDYILMGAMRGIDGELAA